MACIAVVHLLWLLFLPIGVALIVRAAISSRRRVVALAVGLLAIVLSSPAVFFCQAMSPLDFLGFGHAVRVSTSGPGYTVVMVQEPGSDFYDSYLEICRADGKITRLMVDCDASKWWGLHAETQGTLTDFVTGSGAVVSSVDFSNGTVTGSIDRKQYKLQELDFDRCWSNGG